MESGAAGHRGAHQWVRRRIRSETVPRPESWSIVCDGWVVGVVSQVSPGFHRAGDWKWAAQTYPAASGYAVTREEALERVRESVSFGSDGRPELPAVGYLRMGERCASNPPDGGEIPGQR